MSNSEEENNIIEGLNQALANLEGELATARNSNEGDFSNYWKDPESLEEHWRLIEERHLIQKKAAEKEARERKKQNKDFASVLKRLKNQILENEMENNNTDDYTKFSLAATKSSDLADFTSTVKKLETSKQVSRANAQALRRLAGEDNWTIKRNSRGKPLGKQLRLDLTDAGALTPD